MIFILTLVLSLAAAQCTFKLANNHTYDLSTMRAQSDYNVSDGAHTKTSTSRTGLLWWMTTMLPALRAD